MISLKRKIKKRISGLTIIFLLFGNLFCVPLYNANATTFSPNPQRKEVQARASDVFAAYGGSIGFFALECHAVLTEYGDISMILIKEKRMPITNAWGPVDTGDPGESFYNVLTEEHEYLTYTGTTGRYRCTFIITANVDGVEEQIIGHTGEFIIP